MQSVNRRTFLKGSLGTAAMVAVLPQRQSRAANEKVVIGLMGAGGRGRQVVQMFAARPDVEIAWICDPDSRRLGPAKQAVEKAQGKAPQTAQDFRRILDDKNVDAMINATPDHWHALGTILACQAGKDVYVEKPMAHNVWEGRKMIEAARKYQRVVQAGTQNRSAPYGFSAREYIAKGELGKVLDVNVYGMLSGVVGGYPRHAEPDGPVPPGLDWDRWLGPAAQRPYNREVHRGWYGYWDFSGGNASDAIHTLDLARMVMGDPPTRRSRSVPAGACSMTTAARCRTSRSSPTGSRAS